MAANEWSRKSAKRTAKKGQKQTARKARKRAKKCKNGRKQVKTGENFKARKRSGCFLLIVFLAIFQWPYSGGHLGFPSEGRNYMRFPPATCVKMGLFVFLSFRLFFLGFIVFFAVLWECSKGYFGVEKDKW